MAFITIKEFTTSQTDADGLLPFGDAGYTTLNATQLRNTLKDIMQAFRYGNLAGVLSGGVCTASGLVVTVPANTFFVAGGMVWFNESNHTESFADAASTWLWGCSDGLLRQTTTSAQDPDFLGDASCLITFGVAASSVVTLDNGLQQRARTADHTNRVIGENAGVFAPQLMTLPANQVFVIPENCAYNVTGDFYIYGTLVNYGTLRVTGE
jgi:hypothetical protein